MSVVLELNGVSKKYRRTTNVGSYRTLSDSFKAFVRSKTSTNTQSSIESEFFAVKNCSFSIAKGERVGIIGRNGAGKSTLLKLLARITPPSAGTIKINGRVGAMLEVGTGFHPELTGRENIYMSGALLGMTKQEISSQLESIVEFSGVSEFLSLPVKRYSSGMYTRLAFAVASHLRSEVLIVDEVLAVGDAAFQQKCFNKMNEISRLEGRTILFVSHHMASIQKFCSRAIVLNEGSVLIDTDTSSAIGVYLSNGVDNDGSLVTRQDRVGNGLVRALTLSTSVRSLIASRLRSGEPGHIYLSIKAFANVKAGDLNIYMSIDAPSGERVTAFSNEWTGDHLQEIKSGDTRNFCVTLPKTPLQPGRYFVTIFITVCGEIADWVQSAAAIDVDSGDFYGTGSEPPRLQGSIFVEHRWESRGY